MNFKFDIELYFNWYAEWLNKSVEEIKESAHPFSMLSDWLDIISLKVTSDLIGNKVYFSINADHRNELTNNTRLEGCRVICGTVENINTERNIITIDGKTYLLDYDSSGTFFDEEIYCILTLNYDGSDFLEIDKDGTVTIDEKYINNLIFFEN